HRDSSQLRRRLPVELDRDHGGGTEPLSAALCSAPVTSVDREPEVLTSDNQVHREVAPRPPHALRSTGRELPRIPIGQQLDAVRTDRQLIFVITLARHSLSSQEYLAGALMEAPTNCLHQSVHSAIMAFSVCSFSFLST